MKLKDFLKIAGKLPDEADIEFKIHWPASEIKNSEFSQNEQFSEEIGKHPTYTATGVNMTSYKNHPLDMDSYDHKALFAQMSAAFQKEHGQAVVSLEVKTAKNRPAVGLDKYTTELPIEDKENPENDKVRWYKVNFVDGSSSGWLCWFVSGSAAAAVWHAGNPLRGLADNSGSRGDAWLARDARITHRVRIKGGMHADKNEFC